MMRPIEGTITDPNMDRALGRPSREVLAEIPTAYDPLADGGLPIDVYQQAAAETAVYPRVYTEHQVANMLVRAYMRSEGVTYDLAETWAAYDLDHNETPFNRLVYPLMGLAGEIGEILNKAKKIARDDQGQMDLHQVEDSTKELGDTLWYVAAVATELRARLSDIARSNIAKLRSRKERGVLGGSGDNR